MKFLLSALLVVWFGFSFAPLAQADMVEFIEGATPQQREVSWLWKYLGDFVRACVQSGKECQAQDIKPVLENMLRELPSTPTSVNSDQGRKIQFVSEQANPGLFKTDAGEIHRVAVTEMKPGAVIYINADRLSEAGQKWVGILVHEMVHHQGVPDDSSRLPDRVGAAVASFVASTWQKTSLEEFGHPEVQVTLFSDPMGDRPLHALTIFNENGIDVEGAPNERVPVCNPNETFRGQKVSGMLWRVTNVSGSEGIVKLKGASRVENFCQSGSQARKVLTNFTFLVNLKFPGSVDPRTDWWNQQSTVVPDIAAGISDGSDEDVDLNRTFRIESIQNEQAQYGPGQTLRTHVIVESMDGFVPQVCSGAITATRWPFIRNASTNMFDTIQRCDLKSLGNNRWQLDITHLFPEGARSDLFSISMLFLANETEKRYAVPSFPRYIPLVNPNEKPAMTAVAWGANGLQRTDSLLGKPVVRSFTAPYGQEFDVQVNFTGDAKVLDTVVDIEMIVVKNGQMVIAPNNNFAMSLKDFVKKVSVGKLRNGDTFVSLRMVIPTTFKDVQVLGFKFQHISIKTDDYSWVEMPGTVWSEGWFLGPQLANTK